LARAECAWPPDHPRTEEDAALLVIGVRAGDRHFVGFRPARGGRRVLVVGPPCSGRTTALAVLAQGLLAVRRQVAVVGPDLARLVGAKPGAQTVTGAADDLDRLVALRRRHADLAVVLDDAEGRPDLVPVLREIVRLVDEDDGFVAAGTAPEVVERHGSALVDDLARAETGLLLHPRPGMRVLGVAVGPRDGRTAPPPGRGLLVAGRVVEHVQVALPDPPAASDRGPSPRRS
jgi:DNA segregation ATPase FtsK/SpoIIIE, S-DNA-T family